MIEQIGQSIGFVKEKNINIDRSNIPVCFFLYFGCTHHTKKNFERKLQSSFYDKTNYVEIADYQTIL